jgi:hypothetical protein
MPNLRKYMLFLALMVPATYLYSRPSLEEIPKLRWLNDISVMISKSLAYAKPQAEVSPVDPIAAANVDEDLDYRIAERTKSLEGWRAFLTAHPDGSHAQSVRAELDKLAPPMTPPAPAAEQAPNPGPPPDTRIPSEAVSAPPQSAGTEAPRVASDEICKGDEDRLEQLSKSPTSDGIIRLLIDMRCEKLRPQLVRLAEGLDDKAPKTAADAAPGPSSSISPDPIVSTTDPPLPPRRAVEPQNKARSSADSRGLQPRRHASPSTAPSLPPILLALFGEQPRNSASFRRTRAGGRFGANSAGAGTLTSSGGSAASGSH